jgi:hypothetical protein
MRSFTRWRQAPSIGAPQVLEDVHEVDVAFAGFVDSIQGYHGRR